METKFCKGPICQGKEKPISEFNKDRSRADGHGPYCKECQSYYHRERYKTPEGRQVKLSYNAEFYKTEVGKQSRVKAYWEEVRKNPNHRKARAAVNNAIAKGKLTKASTHHCHYPDCDKQAKEYHHFSYEPAHWLDVIPYCIEHHRIIDSQS